jgi:LPXTG-motif cell wall-anchored protein
MKKVLIVAGILLLLLAFTATIALAQAGDTAKGKTLWAQNNCKNCHGDNGEGKYAGMRAGDGKTAADWIKQSRTPRANMPAYTTAQLSDADLTDMWAYMQTLTRPTAFTPTTAPTQAGDPAGKVVFGEKRCVACHANAAAFVKARFVDQKREVTTEAILKQLRTPAKAMPVYSATQVTDAQAGQIAEFLKSQAAAAPAAAPAAAAPAPATMPKTGGEIGLLVLGGLSALAIGGGLVLRGRRRG